MTTTLGLMRLYPNTPVIFTGFSDRLVRGKLSESDDTLTFLKETIELIERIVLETRSRNTIENARYVKEPTTFAEVLGFWSLLRFTGHARLKDFPTIKSTSRLIQPIFAQITQIVAFAGTSQGGPANSRS